MMEQNAKITKEMIRSLFPPRKINAQKGDFGRLLCITGSRNMPGACFLSTSAALRCGVGLLTVMTIPENVTRLASAVPEAMWYPFDADCDGFMKLDLKAGTEEIEVPLRLRNLMEEANAILIGCGLGRTKGIERLVNYVLENAKCPVVLDADGLYAISDHLEQIRTPKTDLILTPHPGEMAKLCGSSVSQVQENRAWIAKTFTRSYHVTLVLKGAGTIIAEGGIHGDLIENTTGNPGMSRGGSGDVLAGMIAALAARGFSPWDAACGGAFLHGYAGDIAAREMTQEAMLPRDILTAIPIAFDEILGSY